MKESSQASSDSHFHSYKINLLDALEAEAIFIMRETAAQFENSCLLFSGGKDSILMAWLAKKAFAPAKIPFPFLHVDTGHNFPETIAYRDKLIKNIDARLLVASVQKSIDEGKVKEETGANASRNSLQSVTLLDAIEEHKFDAALGGGRRDEEKARAKERFFSHRDEFGAWDPKNQRPELWNLFNGNKNLGENFRVFPLSNWTELDVWLYIQKEKVPLPELYFAKKRKVFQRGENLLAVTKYTQALPEEKVSEQMVRFRTIGDTTCTCAFPSNASNISEIIAEIAASRQAERGLRADDKRSESSMEDRKKQGYF